MFQVNKIDDDDYDGDDDDYDGDDDDGNDGDEDQLFCFVLN